MYLRIKRERFDNLPDIIMSAAVSIGAPMIQQATGQHLTMVYPTSSQLTTLRNKLSMTLESLSHRPEATQLMAELGRCSAMFLVSTTHELIVASDHSPDEFRTIRGMYECLLPHYDDFGNGCAMVIRRLGAMPAEQERGQP